MNINAWAILMILLILRGLSPFLRIVQLLSVVLGVSDPDLFNFSPTLSN